MEQSNIMPEFTLATKAECRKLNLAAKYLLVTEGEPGHESWVGHSLCYLGTHLEQYALTAREDEFEESKQEVTIWTVLPGEAPYRPGLYVNLWNKIGDADQQDTDKTYWRLTIYHFSDTKQVTVEESFACYSTDSSLAQNPETPLHLPSAEMLDMRKKQRTREVNKIQKSLKNALTLGDRDRLSRVLTEFDPSKVVPSYEDSSQWD